MIEIPARLLDITRLSRRAGRRLTGIDRVELAYVHALTEAEEQCFGLAKTSYGYVIIRPNALRQVVQRICNNNMRKPDILSRFANRLTPAQRCAETELRSFSIARGRPYQLERMIRRHIPRGFAYLNVGHSNLTFDVMRAVKAAGGRITVMIHDMIPLDFPEFQRHGTEDRFRDKMRVVQDHAHLILCNSAYTADRVEAHFSLSGTSPAIEVAHLGVDQSKTAIAHQNVPTEAYFMCIGTIEPRKNVAFLLDIWEKLGATAPGLILSGARGWRNESLFDRLDDLPATGPIRELGPISDEEQIALLSNANALLFPSLEEGFGLPAVEAARLGVPIICNKLPVFKEILGAYPNYAGKCNDAEWLQLINELTKLPPERRAPETRFTWDRHFGHVLKYT